MVKVTLSRKELYVLVWSKPLSALAKEFHISDVGLRKICLKMAIPLPGNGYWMKIKYNKKVKKTTLPKNHQVIQQVTLTNRDISSIVASHPTSEIKYLIDDIQTTPGLPLKVPARLSKPDKLIIEARQSLNAKKHSDYYQKGVYTTSYSQIDIKASPANTARALRIMDTLVKLLRIRGHDILIKNRNTYAVIEGQDIKISLKEQMRRKIIPGKYYNTDELHPTGLLTFRFDDHSNKSVNDSKIQIEEKLPRLLARLELLGKKKKQEQIRLEEYWRVQKEKRRKEEELKALKKKELSDFLSLFKQAERFKRAQQIRNYVDKYEAFTISNQSVTEETTSWINWALQKADWFDPFINAEDTLLNDINKDELFSNNQTNRGGNYWQKQNLLY